MIPCEYCGAVITMADVLTTEEHDPVGCRTALMAQQQAAQARLVESIRKLLDENIALRERCVELERRAYHALREGGR